MNIRIVRILRLGLPPACAAQHDCLHITPGMKPLRALTGRVASRPARDGTHPLAAPCPTIRWLYEDMKACRLLNLPPARHPNGFLAHARSHSAPVGRWTRSNAVTTNRSCHQERLRLCWSHGDDHCSHTTRTRRPQAGLIRDGIVHWPVVLESRIRVEAMLRPYTASLITVNHPLSQVSLIAHRERCPSVGTAGRHPFLELDIAGSQRNQIRAVAK